MFKVIKKSKHSKARLTLLKTPHGNIRGPFFMPIATYGAVKNLTPEELKELGAEIILSNTYHTYFRPGLEIIKKAKGLHNFMNWPGPILTDSGGYQVFSLSKHLKIDDAGVRFSDPISGQKIYLTPEQAIKIQNDLGSDIWMVLDVCPAYPAIEDKVAEAVRLTSSWADKSLTAAKKALSKRAPGKQSLVFGIIQGGVYQKLRERSASEITALNFDGYAIGGVAVGEPRKYLKSVLKWVMHVLPENKPRYLMGLGKPEEIVEATKQGIDMFDCVIPTREARHGKLYCWNNKSGIMNYAMKNFYQAINIKNAKFAKDLSPINNTNLKHFSKAYLHHLFKINEPLGMRLATLNNLNFYLGLMKKIQISIKTGKI